MQFDIDGHKAYAYTGGRVLDPALPGVVFLHGALADHGVWGLQSRYLAHHGHAVLALDLPGHGRSEGPALDVVQAGAWVVKAVQAAGLQRVALVGHSMGSLIALEAAAALGERTRHLFMVGTAYPMKVSAALLQMSVEQPLQAIDMVNNLSFASHASKPSAPGPGFSLHGNNRALMRRNQANYRAGNLFHFVFQACDSYAGLAEAAPRLRCPVTLVLGSRDQMTSPRAVGLLVEALKPRVVTLPSGHTLMGEVPDALLDTLKAGLASS
jgi:pimeloyl-ACP methyl ester carboxylesterase